MQLVRITLGNNTWEQELIEEILSENKPDDYEGWCGYREDDRCVEYFVITQVDGQWRMGHDVVYVGRDFGSVAGSWSDVQVEFLCIPGFRTQGYFSWDIWRQLPGGYCDIGTMYDDELPF